VHKHFWSVVLLSPAAFALCLVSLVGVTAEIARADLPELKWESGKDGFSKNSDRHPLISLKQPRQATDTATFLQALAVMKTTSSLKLQPGIKFTNLIPIDSFTSAKASEQTNLQNDVSKFDNNQEIAPVNWVSQLSDIQSSDTQLELGNLETSTNNGMDRVTNVSQLRDVQPTDWAYEALRQLVEKYGCIAGYADGTFRGNRALSRYEFAAGLNTCLQQVEKLIAAGFNNIAREDLEKLSQLSNEFGTELSNMRSRINNLLAEFSYIVTPAAPLGNFMFALAQESFSQNS
jgi:S-layer homology domain